MHKSLSSVGSPDHTELSKGAVGKSSSSSSSLGSTIGGDESSKFQCL